MRSRYGLIVSWTYVVMGVLLLTPFWLGLLAQAQALVDRFAGLPEGPRAQPFRGVASTYVPLLLAVGVGFVYLCRTTDGTAFDSCSRCFH
ncbi:MAG: hypothetical protein ACREN5_01320 [Gemmatimonadales bacterium]